MNVEAKSRNGIDLYCPGHMGIGASGCGLKLINEDRAHVKLGRIRPPRSSNALTYCEKTQNPVPNKKVRYE